MNRKLARALCLGSFLAASASFAQEAPSSAPATTDAPARNEPAPLPSPIPVPLPAWNKAGNDLAPLPAQSLPGDAPSSVEIPAPASVATTQPSAEITAGAKSPRKALWWALSGPIAGASVCALAGAAHPIFATDDKITYATMIGSCLVVPILSANAGHLYANDFKRAQKHTTRRVLWSTAPILAGALGGLGALFAGVSSVDQRNGAIAGAVVGGGIGVGLSIREIIDAPKAARRYNQAHSLSEPSPAPKQDPGATPPDLSAVHPALRIYPGF
jgi:hypothetical protein